MQKSQDFSKYLFLFRLLLSMIIIYNLTIYYMDHSFLVWLIFFITMCFYVAMLWSNFRLTIMHIVIFTVFLFSMIWLSAYISKEPQDYNSVLWAWFVILSFISSREQKVATVVLIIVGLVMLNSGLDNGYPYSLIIVLASIYFGIHSLSRYIRVLKINSEQLTELEQVHLELQRTYKELQDSTVQSIRYAALTERTRIAGEIHDGLGHHFTSLIVQMQALKWMIKQDPDRAESTVDQLLDVSRQGLAEVRSVVKDWSVHEGGVEGLQELASQITHRAGLELHFDSQGTFSIWGEMIDSVLYRVLQESLTNIIRHAEASTVDVTITETAQHVQLSIADDGKYRREHPLQYGFGIQNMIRRCETIHGNCTFAARPQGGLWIKVTLPLSNTSLPKN